MRKIIQMGKLVKKWKGLSKDIAEQILLLAIQFCSQRSERREKLVVENILDGNILENRTNKWCRQKDLTIRKAEIFFARFND